MNNQPLNDEKLSECCGDPAYGEIDEYGFGMCMDCKDHARFTSEEDEAVRDAAMALGEAEAANERSMREEKAAGIFKPHTIYGTD